jgi:two-component system chemotaxis response regulator CheY
VNWLIEYRDYSYDKNMFPLHTKILIVDDMPSVRDLVLRELRNLGYSYVISAKDGIDAWNILKAEYEKKSQIELVISDWNMPFLQGIELLKKVRGTPEIADTPFVLLTSESEKEQVTEAVFLGVSQYILKPFSPKMFEEKLKTAWLKHQKKNVA